MIEISIPAALNAIEEFLQTLPALDQDTLEICMDQLKEIWHIEDPRIQRQIVETVALKLHLL